MATATDEPQKAAPGAQTINVKGMSDRWKTAMSDEGIPKIPPAKEPEPTKPPEPVKAPEPQAEPKQGIPEAPKPKPTEPAKPTEPTKPADPPKPIPSTEFKKLEAARDEFKNKWEAAEARAKEIEAKLSTAVDPKQISELEAKLEKANKQAEQAQEFVDKFYLEHSPSFQKAYGEKIDQAIEEAKEVVGGEVGEQLEKAFRMSPSKARDEEIEKLTEELSNFKQSAVVKSYTELKRLQRERENELKNSKENVKKLREFEEQQAKTRATEFHKSYKSAYAGELSSFEQGVDGFKEIEGNNDYNTIVKSNRERAESFLNAEAPTDRARLALWAAYGVHAQQLNRAQQEHIAKLQAQLAELQGANPGIRSSTAAPSQIKAEGKPGDKTVSRWQEAMTKGIPAKE